MRVPGFNEGGSWIHRVRLSGEFWMVSPAIVGRRGMLVRFGPSTPVAPGKPCKVWQPVQPLLKNSVRPFSGLPGTLGAGVIGPEGITALAMRGVGCVDGRPGTVPAVHPAATNTT